MIKMTSNNISYLLSDYIPWLILALGCFLFFVGFYRLIEEPYHFDVYLTSLDGFWIIALGLLSIVTMYTKHLPKE